MESSSLDSPVFLLLISFPLNHEIRYDSLTGSAGIPTHIWLRFGKLRRLSPTQVIIHRETRVFENADGKAPTDVTTRVNRNGQRYPALFVSQGEVASRLTIFFKSLSLEESYEIAGCDLRHTAHSGTPTVSSSTCTMRSL